MSISPAISTHPASAPRTPPERSVVELTAPGLTVSELAALREELERSRRSRREQQSALDERVAADGDPVAQAHLSYVQDLLGAVQAALDRFDDGTYGSCVHCSAAIPFERLELVPSTDGCVACLRRLAPWR